MIAKNILRKVIIGSTIALVSVSAYAWCSTHTACHGGDCISVTICGPDPVFAPNP